MNWSVGAIGQGIRSPSPRFDGIRVRQRAATPEVEPESVEISRQLDEALPQFCAARKNHRELLERVDGISIENLRDQAR